MVSDDDMPVELSTPPPVNYETLGNIKEPTRRSSRLAARPSTTHSYLPDHELEDSDMVTVSWEYLP